jgi:hypothetical protein
VCLKRFPCSWYIQRKLYTFLVPSLTLSPNGLKRASTWPTSPRSFIRCAKMISMLVVQSAQTVHLSCNEINTLQTDWNDLPLDLRHLGVASGVPKKRFQSLWYIWRKPCTYLALRLIWCPNRIKRASTWPTSPRSTIGCAWKDFRACCTFNANHAPVLCQD